MPVFNKGVLAWRGQGEELVKQWRTVQERRIYDGLPVQTIKAVYGDKLLRQNGLGKNDIQQLGTIAHKLNQNIIDMKKKFSIDTFKQSGETSNISKFGPNNLDKMDTSFPAKSGNLWGTEKILIVDFSGLNAKRDKDQRPEQFKEHVVPGAKILSVGIHGVIPDSWRKSAGYDLIVNTKNADRSASEIYTKIKGNKNIIHFDINEAIIPEGWRWDSKTKGPASVAVKVIEQWKNEHPGGRILLRGHSDGTYGVLHT